MSALRQVRGPRASALFPVLAYAAAEGLFLLDEASLAFGFLCEPLPAGDQGEADRLSVLLNQDWPRDTLLQVRWMTTRSFLRLGARSMRRGT